MAEVGCIAFPFRRAAQLVVNRTRAAATDASVHLLAAAAVPPLHNGNTHNLTAPPRPLIIFR